MHNVYELDTAGLRLAEQARNIAQSTALPLAADVDQRGRFPQEAVTALAEAGFFGLCLPESTDGKDQPPRVFAAVVEELAQGCPSTAMIYVMHVAAARVIAASPLLKRKDDLLREIAAGRHLAFSERGSRSQFWAPVSQLVEDGDGYTATAFKSWVTSARLADSFVCSAQRPGAGSPLDSTLYLARRQSTGVSVKGTFDGLGLRGNDSASPGTICSPSTGRGRR